VWSQIHDSAERSEKIRKSFGFGNKKAVEVEREDCRGCRVYGITKIFGKSRGNK
jgi:hypothetical protein